MQISLRSQLIAGTAAVVGASAIAMTPVTAAHISLPSVQVPSAAQVVLAGFDSPLSELLLTSGVFSNYLFNGFDDPTDLLTLEGNETWAFSGFTGIPFPGLLGFADLGGYENVGLIPQIITDALPIVGQLGYNGSLYLQVTASSVLAAGVALSEGVWNAGGQLLSFDLPGALQTLIESVSEAGTFLLNAGGFVLTEVIDNLTAVVETVVDLVPSLLGITLRQIQVVGDSVGLVFNNFFDAFGTTEPIENAWNAVVNGLLGPSGIPGTLANLTIGAGVQTNPLDPTSFVPSIRGEVQTGVKLIANAIGAAYTPVPPLAATPAPAASEGSVVTPVNELAAEPAGDVQADTSAIAAVTESDDAPVSPRGARGARSAAVSEAPAASAGDDEGAAKSTPKRAARGAKKASSAE